ISDTAASFKCVVCLRAVDEGEKVRQISACGHVFHQECINMWLSSHTSCPVCRGKAAPADELADAIVARISVTPDVIVPASSLAVRSACRPSPLRCRARPPLLCRRAPPAARICACPSSLLPPLA
ncbi:Os01g0690333, partial [Oryza sativa Japonica Group]